jgi:hypothetical protein
MKAQVHYFWEVSEIGSASSNDWMFYFMILWRQEKLRVRHKMINWNVSFHVPFLIGRLYFWLKGLRHPVGFFVLLTFCISCLFILTLVYFCLMKLRHMRKLLPLLTLSIIYIFLIRLFYLYDRGHWHSHISAFSFSLCISIACY